MKEIITNLGLFIVFCIVFSGLSGCSGKVSSTANTSAANTAASPSSASPAKSNSQSSAYPPLAAGLADADIELLDGTVTRVSERKGKVILLNLWGIWCGPCRGEMPHLVALQDQYRDQGFEVIGLNIGDENQNPEDMGAIKAFGEKMKLNYTLGRVKRDTTAQVYKITHEEVVPQSLLVDREGHLRGVFIGAGPNVVSKIQETVAKAIGE